MGADNDIRAYIRDSVKQGASIASVRNKLIRAGHSERSVDQYLQEIIRKPHTSFSVPALVNGILIGVVLLVAFTLPSLRSGSPITGSTVVPVSELQAQSNAVCGYPYIQYADGCCLDRNENRVCDVLEETPEERGISSSYPFSLNSHVASRNGFSISIDGFDYQVTGVTGNLMNVNFTITNEADRLIVPIMKFRLENADEEGEEKTVILETTLDVGEYIIKNEELNLLIPKTNKEQTLVVTLEDSITNPSEELVTISVPFAITK